MEDVKKENNEKELQSKANASELGADSVDAPAGVVSQPPQNTTDDTSAANDVVSDKNDSAMCSDPVQNNGESECRQENNAAASAELEPPTDSVTSSETVKDTTVQEPASPEQPTEDTVVPDDDADAGDDVKDTSHDISREDDDSSALDESSKHLDFEARLQSMIAEAQIKLPEEAPPSKEEVPTQHEGLDEVRLYMYDAWF